jgi:hypothetical protein
MTDTKPEPLITPLMQGVWFVEMIGDDGRPMLWIRETRPTADDLREMAATKREEQ